MFILFGDVYGLDGYFRVGIGVFSDYLEKGLERISYYVKYKYGV